MYNLGDTLTEVAENKAPAHKEAYKLLDLAWQRLIELREIDPRYKEATEHALKALLRLDGIKLDGI